jgi:starvation-inducible DNA-binding protein
MDTYDKSYTNELNILLASYQIHYQNLRSLHWNIKGQNFFELHLKYEELYTRAQIIIDDIAERVLTLGVIPFSSLSDYLRESIIDENSIITNGEIGVHYIFNSQQLLLTLERSLIKKSANFEDEGTNSLLSDLVREKEKTNWMFSSWLK